MKFWGAVVLINIMLWYLLNMFILKLSPDSHYYLSQAESIRMHGLKSFIITNSSIPYYWGFPIYLFIAKLVFGNYFSQLILITQFTLTSIIPILLRGIYKVVFNSEGSVIVCFLFIFSLDVLQWSNFLLTDIYSLFFSVLFIYLVVRSKDLNFYVLLILIPLLCFTLLAFRASNFIILICSTYYLITLKKEYVFSLLIIFSVCVFSFTLFQSSNNKNNAFSIYSKLETFENNFKKGEVINDRPYYNLRPFTPKENIIIYATKLYLLRLVNYWRFYSSAFSRFHNAFNVIYFAVCYVFAGISIFKIRRYKFNEGRIFILTLIIIYFISTCITMIDYDWRYRIPALTFLILFSSNGISIIYNKFSFNRRLLPGNK